MPATCPADPAATLTTVRARIAAVSVTALLLAGCGGGARTITVTTSARTPPATRTTTERPAPGGGSNCGGSACAANAAAAAAIVKAHGFDTEARTFLPGAPLTAVIGVRSGSQDGTAQNAFFFAGGRYIGTDTADMSAGIRVGPQAGDTVTLTYRLYAPNDPQCCSTAGTASVRYHWDGSRLTPLDPIPPSAYNSAGSRR